MALRKEMLRLYQSQEQVIHTANNRNQDIFNRFFVAGQPALITRA